jgi:hypothetical protein
MVAYWPASLCSLTGRYVNPMPQSTLSPQSGLRNLTTDHGGNFNYYKPVKFGKSLNRKAACKLLYIIFRTKKRYNFNYGVLKPDMAKER